MWTSDKGERRAEHAVTSPIVETLGVSRIIHTDDRMISPVSDVTLRVGYGEFAVIFGRSGAGKSTLMNMLMGLDQPDIGEVFLKGSSLYEYSDEQRTTIRRKKVSYLPSNTFWIESMSVVDNVALPLYLLGHSQRHSRKVASQMLGDVGLFDKANAKPTDLSSGQQQIVALARALVKEPWLLFADEPTAHLDTRSAEEVTQILMTACREMGITIVMVTHDLNFLKLSDRWFYMQDGRLWDIEDRDTSLDDIQQVMALIEAQTARNPVNA